MSKPDFVENATNVYRTSEFIVRQIMGFRNNSERGVAFISHDTYYHRTRERDAEYELAFFMRDHIDGKRLPSNMYSRKYVD